MEWVGASDGDGRVAAVPFNKTRGGGQRSVLSLTGGPRSLTECGRSGVVQAVNAAATDQPAAGGEGRYPRPRQDGGQWNDRPKYTLEAMLSQP